MYDPTKPVDVIEKPPAEPGARPKPAVKLPAPITQYDEAAQSMRCPADRFFSALALLQAPKYLNQTFDWFGHWDSRRRLWVNQNGSTVTLGELETEMVSRCVELGVDRQLVEEFGRSVLSIAQSQAFHRLSFEEKMCHFKVVVSK
jgi:hypothetical protein